MKGYKAFNQDMTCRGFQFEEGQIYEHKGKIKACQSGFHFCENPLDVLDYYDLCDSEFAEVEAIGKTETEGNKSVTDKIKIGAKVGLPGFIKASFDFLWEKCNADQRPNAGNSSQLAASGNYSKLALNGNNSVGAAIGQSGQIKATLGCWIVLAEWEWVDDVYTPVCVKSVKVDGKKIKADTWYELKNGKFVEVD